jgi:hypothetical protein
VLHCCLCQPACLVAAIVSGCCWTLECCVWQAGRHGTWCCKKPASVCMHHRTRHVHPGAASPSIGPWHQMSAWHCQSTAQHSTAQHSTAACCACSAPITPPSFDAPRPCPARAVCAAHRCASPVSDADGPCHLAYAVGAAQAGQVRHVVCRWGAAGLQWLRRQLLLEPLPPYAQIPSAYSPVRRHGQPLVLVCCSALCTRVTT